MEMVNGYVFLDLTKANVYAKALKVLTADKPVVINDGTGAPYFVDSMTVDGTNVVITKGGKTITIANDNTITNVGEISTIMENIVDSQGNKRFVNGDINIQTISGVEKTYGKWSLSGSHLMLVLAIDITNITINANDEFAIIELPNYIIDKIYSVYSVYIMTNEYKLIGHGTTDTTLDVRLTKENNKIVIKSAETKSLASYTFSVRIQFDLLIDADYSE